MPVLLICIGIQCITLSVEHEGGRLHYHVSIRPGSASRQSRARRPSTGMHIGMPPITRTGLDLSVVQVVDNDQGASPSQPAPPLRAQDLGGLLIWVALDRTRGFESAGRRRLPSRSGPSSPARSSDLPAPEPVGAPSPTPLRGCPVPSGRSADAPLRACLDARQHPISRIGRQADACRPGDSIETSIDRAAPAAAPAHACMGRECHPGLDRPRRR